jgi:hypothetical protein
MKDLEHPVGSRDVAVVVEGFDPKTGKTLWTFAAGRALGLVTFLHLPTQLDRNAVVLQDAHGRYVEADLGRGPGRRLAKTRTGWCRSPILFKLDTGGSLAQYVGQLSAYHCDLRQRRLSVPAHAPAFLGSIGARIGGLVAWSDTSGVFAAPVAGS